MPHALRAVPWGTRLAFRNAGHRSEAPPDSGRLAIRAERRRRVLTPRHEASARVVIMRGERAAMLLVAEPGRWRLRLADLLRRAAGGVFVVDDDDEALDYVFGTGAYAYRASRRPPRVVVRALRAPGENGVDLLRLLKADRRSRLIPVVVLAETANERHMRVCYRLGANSYVLVPRSPGGLTRAAAMIGSYWTSRNTPFEGSPWTPRERNSGPTTARRAWS